MRPCLLNTFPIACCLMSLVLNGAGKLLILQEPERAVDNTVDGIRYTCISENDRAALVWNEDSKYYDQKQHVPKEFRSIRVRNMTKCALVESKNCTAYWRESLYWNIVNSRDHPMGPVLDSRWEDFAETSFREANHDHKNYQYVMKMTESNNVVFSVRGSQNISIRICKENNTEDGWCLTITLGTARNHINYCMFTDFGKRDEKACINPDQTAQSKEILFSKLLWRTFVLKWNIQNITVWNGFRCIFEIPLKQGSWLQNKYFFMNMDDGLMRFHFYDYLLTTRDGTTLESDKFYNNEQNLCFEFITGLCVGCYLEIYVVDVKGKSKWLTSIDRTRPFVFGGMLTWQRVKLNTTVKADNVGQLSLKVITRLNQSNSQPQWAIDTLRKCKSPDARRELTFKRILSKIPNSIQPLDYCQRMSYDPEESLAVNLYFTSVSNHISVSMQEYLRKTSYSQAPCLPNWWERTLICDRFGCVCIEKFSNNVTTVDHCGYKKTYSTIYKVPDHLDFEENEKLEVNQTETSIEVKIPTIANGISDSEVVIVVKGLSTCTSQKLPNELRKRINMTESEKGWIAATFFANQPRSTVIIPIEQRPAAKDTSKDCSLRPGETYIIVVVVVVKKDIASAFIASLPTEITVKNNIENSISGWIISFFILAISLLLLFIWRRKIKAALRQVRIQNFITYSQTLVNFIKSTTEQSTTVGETSMDVTLSAIVSTSERVLPERSSSFTRISIKDFENDVKESIASEPLKSESAIIGETSMNVTPSANVSTRERVLPERSSSFTRISIKDFENYVKESIASEPLKSESAIVGETSMNVTPSANVSTRERVLPKRSSSSTSISIEDFENYVKESISSELLKSQFVMLQKGPLRPCAYGSLPEHKSKNRYANILPYDDTRVILKKNSGVSHSDYINANYVQGFRKKNAYIAAQGPKQQTVNDFWRMIWQEETLVICMLANLFESRKEKCAQYWPEFGASRTYGDVVVVTESHQVLADYTFRTFRVSCGKNTRKIEHMHYTGWPDHTVPWYTHPMISYLGKLLTIEIGKGPIVVHCSAGVGRTGTFILCDICLQQAAETGKIDVLTEFRKLRDCRLNMVDNETQYLFAHVVLAECFVSLPTKLPCDNDLPQAIEVLKTQLPQHIQRLNDTAWQDQALRSSSIKPMPLIMENVKKNRVPELAPVSNSLVYLKRYPTHDDNSYYINAIIVDGVRVRKQYLASQLPLPSTLSDFWRLVAEQEVQHIVVLQRPDPNDSTCCSIIADERSFDPVPFINVKVKTSRKTGKNSIIDELLLTDHSEGEVARTQQVSMLTCTEWGLGKDGKPPPPKNLVDFWIASQNICREEGPTLVLCHDGVTGCGLYLALSFLLERMAVEGECDIILAVRAIRRSRTEFVQSQEQFEYLYDAAAKYIEAFETYANFA